MTYYIRYNGIQDWFEPCDNNGLLELVNGNQIIPSENDALLSCVDLNKLYDFVTPTAGRANIYIVTTPAIVVPYGNYYRVTRKGIITLLS